MSPLEVFWARCDGSIVFGTNDCCMALADTILAAGGPDLMAGYRGRYASARGFVRAFRRAGHNDLFAACEASFALNGALVDQAADFDVAMVGYLDVSRRSVNSPAFFHGGFWNIRSDHGMLVLAHGVFEGDPRIYRVV